MTVLSGRSFATYHLGRIIHVRIEGDLFPELHKKLEFCKVEGAEPDITIERGDPNPDLGFGPRAENYMVDDSFQSVVVAWRSKIGEELLVSDGRYEIVGEGGAYEISPGRVTIHGRASDGFMELLLRPLINEIIVPRGSIMAHGGAVMIDDKAVLLLGESGKTSLVLSLMARGAGYLADEHVILSPGGDCRPYTPYMWLDGRHFSMFPELVEPCFPVMAERRRMRTKLSFNGMGSRFDGGHIITRQIREYLTTGTFFAGLGCRFDKPYPGSKMPSSGKVSHVFHLRATNEEAKTVPIAHNRIAEIESTCAWIRTGHLSTMARLAGSPTLDLGSMERAFSGCIEKARCNQICVKRRERRTREDVERAADEIMRVVGD